MWGWTKNVSNAASIIPKNDEILEYYKLFELKWQTREKATECWILIPFSVSKWCVNSCLWYTDLKTHLFIRQLPMSNRSISRILLSNRPPPFHFLSRTKTGVWYSMLFETSDNDAQINGLGKVWKHTWKKILGFTSGYFYYSATSLVKRLFSAFDLYPAQSFVWG